MMMSCKVTFAVLCIININEAFQLRQSSEEKSIQVRKFEYNTTGEQQKDCGGDGLPGAGYGISGGQQDGWSYSPSQQSSFARVKRNTDPTTVLGKPIQFPVKDPQCKFGLPSPDAKVCCSAACWTCDLNAMCPDPKEYMDVKGQQASLCCPSRILAQDNSCDTNKPPCVPSKKTKEYLLDKHVTDPKHQRNKNRIKMYEFRRQLYFQAKVHFDWGRDIAGNVWQGAHLKVTNAWDQVALYKKQIAEAKKSKQTRAVASSIQTLENSIESETDEARFYAQIRRNAIWVHENSTAGLNVVDELKYAITFDVDKIDNYQPQVESLHTRSVSLHEAAKLLWKQWQTGDKTYPCILPSVMHADSLCTDPDTGTKRCPVKCAVGYDGEDSSNTLRCLKQGEFGKELYGEMSGMAVCPGRNCGKPPAVHKALVTMQDVIFPNAAQYRCSEGYSMDGQADGQKSFSLPCENKGAFPQKDYTCKPVTCGAALVLGHSQVVPQGELVYTNVASYTCDKGYTVDGTAGGLTEFQASCLSNGKLSVTPTCMPVRCGPPPELKHTNLVSRAAGDQHFPTRIEYGCKTGYSLNQQANGVKRFVLACYPDGEFWVKDHPGVQLSANSCRPISAGVAPKVEHSDFVSREMFYSETARISADMGYSTVGKPDAGLAFTLGVSADGKYTGVQTFVPVQCGSAPAVPNSKNNADQRMKQNSHFGDVILYGCADGYSVDATEQEGSASFSVKCESDASFSQIPGQGSCVNIDDCADHTCGPFGSCVDKLLNYTCSCQSGYQETYNEKLEERVCGNIDDCGPEACGVGQCVDLVNDYKCDCPRGYHQETDGEERTCELNVCGNPPRVSHASTQPLAKQFAKSFFQDTVLYQCATGFTLDGTVKGKHGFKIDCHADKSFSPKGTCRPISCGAVPTVEFASSSIAAGVYSDTVTYTCQTGYSSDATAEGDKSFSAQCLSSGLFSEPLECQRILCGEADDVANAHRPAGNKRFGDIVSYHCFDGFTLDGQRDSKSSFETKCQASGELTQPKECKPKVCGHAPSKINALYATIQGDEVHYPKAAIVTCRDGYTLGGSPQGARELVVKCGVNGLFDDTDPKGCQPVKCGALPQMTDATLSKLLGPDGKASGKDHLAFGDKAYYRCRTGFTAGGEPEAVAEIHAECSDHGVYSLPDDAMQCTNVNDCAGHTCGPHGSCVDQIGAAPAYTCKCEAGYELNTLPNGEKVCGNIDDCGGKSCGAGTCKDLVGDYTCICPSGYYIGFDNKDKTCLPVTCVAEPPGLSNGRLLSAHRGPVEFPRRLRYQCAEGYSTDGSAQDAKKEFQASCGAYTRMTGMLSCQKVTCGVPKVFPLTRLTSPNARRLMSFNDVAAYECFAGHTIGGRANGAKGFSVKCQASAELSAPGVCAPVKCGPAPRITKARAGIAGDLYFGMTASYQCDKGHTVVGRQASTFTLRCENNGGFSGRPADRPCTPVSAGTLPTIRNADLWEYAGSRVNGGSKVGFYPDVFKYKCKPGYSTTGNAANGDIWFALVNSVGVIVPALPAECKLITFMVHGQAKDARTGRGLAGVTVTIVGTGQTVSTNNGFFSFHNVPKGSVKVRYTRNGFITSEQQITLAADINNGGFADVNMSPKMSSSEWRATLKWAQSPRDLDTYAKWGSGKTYYGKKYRSASGLSAKLEKDDTNGEGPETVYFKGIGTCRGNAFACDIKYMINDYSKTKNMPNYRSEVTLYTGQRTAGTWKLSDCPRAISRDKNWWHVFTIDGKTNRVKWHCGMGTASGQVLLNSAGLNATSVIESNATSHVQPSLSAKKFLQ